MRRLACKGLHHQVRHAVRLQRMAKLVGRLLPPRDSAVAQRDILRAFDREARRRLIDEPIVRTGVDVEASARPR
jgi:hypothetical protein